MNKLHIYPTSRALREINIKNKQSDGLLPSLMRMDEFEERAVLLEDKLRIDPLQRILLLREAADFSSFENLKMDMSLVKFFTKSDSLFKFFEELSAEKVDFKTLTKADAYAEFESHIEILEQLLHNYKKILDEKGFTDKAFTPSHYSVNDGFLKNYDSVDVHMEGYISRFELEVLEDISAYVPLSIHYTTSSFNKKMQERFADIGATIPNDSHVHFSLTDKKIINAESNDLEIVADIFSVEERDEQIAVAFSAIQKMVDNGIDPDNIALVLPDEDFKEHLAIFDSHNNLNFAMGYDYSQGKNYKSLNSIYRFWQTFDKESQTLMAHYGVDSKKLESVSPSLKATVTDFFDFIHRLGLLECPLLGMDAEKKINTKVQDKYLYFLKIFTEEELSMKEWMFLWLKSLSQITIDDIKGGRVTVMGVLETRAVSFDGVVILDFNEGVVPASSSKDQFLNSSVRAFATLPTRKDRESLQKQYYKRLLEQSQESVIVYSISENKLPSKFLYELGLQEAKHVRGQLDLFYNETPQLLEDEDPIVKDFNASDIEWSASRLNTFLTCKRKYHNRYILKIRQKEEDEMNEGAFLHQLLDHLHKEKDSYDSADEMMRDISMLMDTLLPSLDVKVKYKKLLWNKKLEGYVCSQISHFNNGWKVVAREKEFSGNIGGLQFKGRIDRIDQNDTDILVLDYKSGKTTEANRTKNLEKLTDFQMSIYHAMLIPEYQHVNLAFIKVLEEGKQEEITVLEEKNLLLLDHISKLKQTNEFIAEKCDDLTKCKYCEFALMCGRGEYL